MRRPALGLALLAFATASLLAPREATTAPTSKASKKKPARKPVKKKPAKKATKAPAPPPRPAFPCSAMPWRPLLLSTHIHPLKGAAGEPSAEAHVVQDLLVVQQSTLEPSQDPRFFLSFGAPGLPRSMRISFAALQEGELGAPRDLSRLHELSYVQAPVSDQACVVLGRARESGVVVKLSQEAQLAPQTLGVLRVEQITPLGHAGETDRDLVVRLPSWEEQTVRLGSLSATQPLRAELCAHGHPAVPVSGSLLFQPRELRHDLCVTLLP